MFSLLLLAFTTSIAGLGILLIRIPSIVDAFAHLCVLAFAVGTIFKINPNLSYLTCSLLFAFGYKTFGLKKHGHTIDIFLSSQFLLLLGGVLCAINGFTLHDFEDILISKTSFETLKYECTAFLLFSAVFFYFAREYIFEQAVGIKLIARKNIYTILCDILLVAALCFVVSISFRYYGFLICGLAILLPVLTVANFTKNSLIIVLCSVLIIVLLNICADYIAILAQNYIKSKIILENCNKMLLCGLMYLLYCVSALCKFGRI